MNKKFHLFEIYYKQGRRITFLLCMNLLFLTLSVITAAVQKKHSKLATVLFISIGILLIINIVISTRKNINIIRCIEDNLFQGNFGVTAYRIHQFHKLVDENLFEYHFQPIIDARSGEIFAYEALMRTNSDKINLPPPEILALAEKENCLYDIEKHTFFNVLKIMNSYSDLFAKKKLFISSLPDQQLSEEDFNRLYADYSPLFQNIVLEIKPNFRTDKKCVQLLHKRLQLTRCQMALDGYGTVNSDEASLLHTCPDYVKLDSSVLHCINIDTDKQQRMAKIISFASQNNMKVIAAGIENYDEFEYAIRLGADYLQGSYTIRPQTVLLKSMPEELMKLIHAANFKCIYAHFLQKIYETKGEDLISPAAVALKGYTDILIHEKAITFEGNPGMTADISLIIPCNHCCHIILNNAALRGNDRPSIIIGRNSHVIIELIGDNLLAVNGIRVQESSSLMITGSGNLTVRAADTNRVGIGGTVEQDYGNIILASQGSIKVINHGSNSVGIGGGHCEKTSLIHLKSGNITVETSGYTSVGIGCMSGNTKIIIHNCRLDIVTEGTKAVSIGSVKGHADIRLDSMIDINCDGKQCSAIGVIDNSDGSIIIDGGTINIRFTSHAGAGIGCINGKVGINIYGGELTVYGEGTDIVGIGDQSGFGKIYINHGIISIILYAANAVPIGNVQRYVIIDGGNIQCDFPEDIIPVNSYQAPLAAHIITEADEFRQLVETIQYSYIYKAGNSIRFPYIKVYLPDNIILT